MKRRVMLLCFQNQRTVQQFKSGELSGDAAKAAYIRIVKSRPARLGLI